MEDCISDCSPTADGKLCLAVDMSTEKTEMLGIDDEVIVTPPTFMRELSLLKEESCKQH